MYLCICLKSLEKIKHRKEKLYYYFIMCYIYLYICIDTIHTYDVCKKNTFLLIINIYKYIYYIHKLLDVIFTTENVIFF